MNKYLLPAFLLSILHSILFFNFGFDISVILYILPLLIFVVYVLKKENKIKNRYGLLLIIPIVILSFVYFVTDHWLFRLLNLFVIPLLLIIMYIFIIKNNYDLLSLIKDSFLFIKEPFSYNDEIYNIVKDKLFNKVNISQSTKNKIKSFLMVLPIIIIVLLLLSSADMIFENTFTYIFLGIKTILKCCFKGNIIIRLIIMIVIFISISGTIYYIINDYNNEEVEDIVEKRNFINTESIKMLFVILNLIYLIFDFIQIKSLLFHSVGESINYAEYARQGFFQLMLVSLINLILILFAKNYMLKENLKDNKFYKIMSLLMIGLTSIIIVSSFLRMNLYEQQYGYTLLRLLVYVSLITEVILIIPTINYVFKPNYNILIRYFIIILSIYTLINYINVDKIIATRNIERYYEKQNIDLDYLFNKRVGNLEVLLEFYKEVEDNEIKEELDNYFKRFKMFEINDNVLEYNFYYDKTDRILNKRKK